MYWSKYPCTLYTQAETDLHQASVDASYTSKRLEEEMDSFEQKKLQDIKVSTCIDKYCVWWKP